MISLDEVIGHLETLHHEMEQETYGRSGEQLTNSLYCERLQSAINSLDLINIALTNITSGEPYIGSHSQFAGD